MYSRPPDNLRNRIKIPDNYHGNAFNGANDLTSRYSDMREDDSRGTTEKIMQEAFPPLPDPTPVEATTLFSNEEGGSGEADGDTAVSALTEKNTVSPFSSLLPSFIGSSAHFPFGHGIGSEEILILAMMAMIFMAEGETDNELLLILGLLLFAG